MYQLFPVSMSTVKYFFSVNKKLLWMQPYRNSAVTDGSFDKVNQLDFPYELQFLSKTQFSCCFDVQLEKMLLWLVTRTGHIPGLPTVVTGVVYWKLTDETYQLWKLSGFRFKGTDMFGETTAVHFLRTGPQIE